MGLDITAYEKVTLIRADEPGVDWDEEDGTDQLYSTHWPERADGLVDGVYRYGGEVLGFRAGSYSGYNRWREDLAKLLGTTPEKVWSDPKPGPFLELIAFADNEGVIGPVTSAKLARDFAEYAGKAETFAATLPLSDGPYWLGKYRSWQRAFEIAAKGGAVKFH